jgi:anti-sigma factor RsiW
MVHDEAWELMLAAYVDQTLDTCRAQKVEAHLASCPACAEAVSVASMGMEAVRGAAVATAGVREDDAAFLAEVERRAARSLAATGAPTPHAEPGWRGALAALGDATQLRPALWFFFSLPVYGVYMAPSPGLLALAAVGLCLGFLMEYASNWEASRHDSR